MTELVDDTAFAKAWSRLLDPATAPDGLQDAWGVLARSKKRVLAALDGEPPARILALAPERMTHLARSLPERDSQAPNALLPALLAELVSLRGRFELSGSTLLLRRGRALLLLIAHVGGLLSVDAREFVAFVPRLGPEHYPFMPPLWDWCVANAPLPGELVALIEHLRSEELDSPILDRLAAWASPSVQGMLDLAAWENGYRSVCEPDWRAAAARWSKGEQDPERDAAVLACTVDPDASTNAHALHLALKHHHVRACVALREARATTPYPVLRAILGAWVESFGATAGDELR